VSKSYKALSAASAIAVALVAGAASASTSVTVSGKANPFFTGQSSAVDSNAAVVSDGDNFALDHPIFGGNVTSSTGTVTITATGSTLNIPGSPSGDLPGGSGLEQSHVYTFSSVGSDNSLNTYTLPINSLVGVFYKPGAPVGNIDKIIEFGSSYTITDPSLIGTKLYLGSWDGYQWSNNSGAFSVNIEGTAVPEPATWAMMLVGFGGLGAALRMRRRVSTATAAA
jgi:hypothetical protein